MRELPPIPGAPPGKLLRRTCRHVGAFTLVKAFHGLLVYQCLTCRKISSLDIRTEKTCLNCGKPLDGRKIHWCCDSHGSEVYYATDRTFWRKCVLERDNYTCQRCGYVITPELKKAFEDKDRELWAIEIREPLATRRGMQAVRFEAMRMVGYRQLEAHHITPLEWGGPEFDIANGECLCMLCHDERHRELNASLKKV